MQKLAFSLLALTSALVALPAFAADHNVSTSEELQTALTAAAASAEDDRIVLSAGSVYTTINGAPFQYFSTSGGSLIIESENGEQRATLDGNNATEVLRLESAAAGAEVGFQIRNLNIINGQGQGDSRRSAGLASYGANVIIENTRLADHRGQGISSGAALYFDGGREYTITLTGSEITDNQTSTSTRASVVHVYRASELVIEGKSAIERNAGHWGTIYLDSSPAAITDSRFKENRGQMGGAINPSGTALVTVLSSEFIDNRATDTSGAGALGFGNYQIEDTLFKNNGARNVAVINTNNSPGQTIKRSRFIGNLSDDGSVVKVGSSLTITNSLFEKNETGTSNAVIECSGQCQIVNSVFADNRLGASVLATRRDAEDALVANTVFLGDNPVVGFGDTSARASLFNNFIDARMPALNHGQLDARSNEENGMDPGLSAEFHPIDGSPLIDGGTTDPSLVRLPDTDYLGHPRVAGDSVDLGWVEYGSTLLTPRITSFSMVSQTATNLENLTFRVEYELAEGEVLAEAAVLTDETQSFRTVSLQDSQFQEMFMDGGARSTTVRVTDTGGRSAAMDLSIQLTALSTGEVITRIERATEAHCAESPDQCGINVMSIRQEGYVEGLNDCLNEREQCPVVFENYVDQGKQQCISNPSSCGIDQGGFDIDLLPTADDGSWSLFGTGQEIRNLAANFAGVAIVWAMIDGSWHAYSSDPDTQAVIRGNSDVKELDTIPAKAGFWVKK